MSEVIIAPSAQADLAAQWDYFADEVGSLDLADRFLGSTEQTFRTLSCTPRLGRHRSFPNPNVQRLRSWKVDGFPNHLIFYREIPEDGGVEVVRVVHGARDLDALFGE